MMTVSVLPLTMMAQDDDMYFVPTKENVAKEKKNYGMPKNTYYSGSQRSVDDYNRKAWEQRDSAASDIIDFSARQGVFSDSLYRGQESQDFQYTQRLSRFDDYLPGEAYWEGYSDGRRDRTWYGSVGYYPWYDSWYDPWYDPWYYGYYRPWGYYGYYGYYGGYYGLYRPRPWGYYGGGYGYHRPGHSGGTRDKRPVNHRPQNLGGTNYGGYRDNSRTSTFGGQHSNGSFGGYRSSSSSGGGSFSGGGHSGGSSGGGGGHSAHGGRSFGGKR